MTKDGWKDISERFYAATGKWHDSEQFGYRLRELKKVWRFIDDKLRKGSGLGRGGENSFLVPDVWWEQNTKVRVVLQSSCSHVVINKLTEFVHYY
jgi:hypothetical protein